MTANDCDNHLWVRSVATIAKLIVPLYAVLTVYDDSGHTWMAYAVFLAVLVTISMLEVGVLHLVCPDRT